MKEHHLWQLEAAPSQKKSFVSPVDRTLHVASLPPAATVNN